jgi:hypothetical protein
LHVRAHLRRGCSVTLIAGTDAIQIRFFPIKSRHLIAKAAREFCEAGWSANCIQQKVAGGVITLFDCRRAQGAERHAAVIEISLGDGCIFQDVLSTIGMNRANFAWPSSTRFKTAAAARNLNVLHIGKRSSDR